MTVVPKSLFIYIHFQQIQRSFPVEMQIGEVPVGAMEVRSQAPTLFFYGVVR